MYSKGYINKKISGIITCIRLNSNSDKSGHISIESQAPKWFWLELCLGIRTVTMSIEG